MFSVGFYQSKNFWPYRKSNLKPFEIEASDLAITPRWLNNSVNFIYAKKKFGANINKYLFKIRIENLFFLKLIKKNVLRLWKTPGNMMRKKKFNSNKFLLVENLKRCHIS